MENSQEIFADGVGEINLSGGMVRIDLVSLAGTKVENEKQPQFKAVQRVVMPPDGFLRSFSAMEDLVKQLVDAGLVKQRENQETPATSTPASSPDGPPKSPNF